MRKYFSFTSFLLVSSLSLIIAATIIDYAWLDRDFFAEGSPIFSKIHILKTFIITISCGLFVIFCYKISVCKNNMISKDIGVDWDEWGVLSWFPDKTSNHAYLSVSVQYLIIWIVIITSTLFLFIFLKEPVFFSMLGSENQPVELLTAVIHLLNAGIFSYIAWLIYKNFNTQKIFNIMQALIITTIFFFIAMEEISWFQHIIGYETPKILSGNEQAETNLHNFYTNYIENAYYFSIFLLLIVIPHLVDGRMHKKIFNYFHIFMPSSFASYAAVLIFSYNYDMWNINLTQISFFITLFIIIYYILINLKMNKNISLELMLFASFLLSQILFLVYGHKTLRMHDLTEYKEFLISLACMIYSLDILNRLYKKIKRSNITSLKT